MKIQPRTWVAAVRAVLAEAVLVVALGVSMLAGTARASTYVVYVPLDSPIYEELGTLDALGYLDTYLDEIKPISRVEAARLTLEAQLNLGDSSHPEPLAEKLVQALRRQLHDEIGWLKSGREDNQPTMFHPLARAQAEYVFSTGERRRWQTGRAGIDAKEGTPLLPNNDGLPTAAGSNEIVRLSGWAGAWGFLTGYAEGAASGPLTRNIEGTSRGRLLGAEAVASLGNFAISFGQQEMWWGTGHFGALSQGNNARPFPAIRVQNIHPTHLPWFLRYLGPFRFQVFFGQLDGDRYFAHPWIDGEIFSFKPLPNFEFGLTHAISFGGQHNNNYGIGGFIGRATAFSTGNPAQGNTNSRGGVYLKFRFPSLRNAIVYQEILGEDNLTTEFRPVGRFLPFLAVSYQGGFYLPRLTADGLTDLRFEYAILEPNYSIHSDSLYWTNDGGLMGYSMGPNASRVDVEIGRWTRDLDRASVDLFYTEQAPTYTTDVAYPGQFYPYPLSKERSFGAALGFMQIPAPAPTVFGPGLASLRGRFAAEYVNHINYAPVGRSVRVMILLSASFDPGFGSFIWN